MYFRHLGAIALLLTLMGCSRTAPVRILYWNIQNGMWAGQEDNYNGFVDYVKSVSPDICIWCEAKTHYRTGSAKSFPDERDSLYLPAHWDELAARYGHKYVFLGGERDFFPQVITSRFPIEGKLRLVGDDSVMVSHGAGWAAVDLGKEKLNIVTVHTWPHRFGFGIPKDPPQLRKESALRHEGDAMRAREMRWVVEHTLGTDPDAADKLWILAGDMNSVSRADNQVYGLPEDAPEFLTQDYLSGLPYLKDAQGALLDSFVATAGSGKRIDYVYCTPPVLERIERLEVAREGFPANVKTPISNFWIPSDHYPIIVDIR